MAETVTYAAVGCGGMGRRHLRGMAALQGASFCNMELVAACDVKREQAELLAGEAEALLGRRPRVFTDVQEMVRALPELRAADVTVESGLHVPVAQAALEAGLHVLCEKPLAVTVRGCTRLIETAARAGRVLSVAENYRRDPIHRLARALIDEGAIGDPRLILQSAIGGGDRISMTIWRHMKDTASMPVDAGVHEADLLRFYMGEFRLVYGESRLHERVRYKGEGNAGGPGGYYGGYRASMPDRIEPTGDDAIYAHISFRNGTVGHWIDDHAGHGERRNERVVWGSKGSFVSSGNRIGRPIRLTLDDAAPIEDAAILEHAPGYRLDPQAAELFGGERVWRYDFAFPETDAKLIALEYYELGECIRTGKAPEVSGEEGRADVALTYAPFEAGRLGRVVSLEDMLDGSADAYQREIDERQGLLG
ncbi:MAG TPA: Gfo/Idh/MocA family oxidoreductase [Chloroflexota bacterium]|nr:Gfo/Idh/MocA family oxidoreductase [Chloroflexota bacterium]